MNRRVMLVIALAVGVTVDGWSGLGVVAVGILTGAIAVTEQDGPKPYDYYERYSDN